MGFSDSLKRLDSMALGAAYGGESATFRIGNPVGSKVEFTSQIQREDTSALVKFGKHVEELEGRVFLWVSRFYTHDSIEKILVPDRNLSVQLDGIWFVWESTVESDQSGFLLQFKQVGFSTGSLQQNRRF